MAAGAEDFVAEGIVEHKGMVEKGAMKSSDVGLVGFKLLEEVWIDSGGGLHTRHADHVCVAYVENRCHKEEEKRERKIGSRGKILVIVLVLISRGSMASLRSFSRPQRIMLPTLYHGMKEHEIGVGLTVSLMLGYYS